MAAGDLKRGDVTPDKLCRTMRAVFMIDAVKSIAPDTALIPLIRAGIDFGLHRQRAMKTSIKDSDLRNVGQNVVDQFNTFQSGLVVQRRNRGHAFDFPPHFRSDSYRLRELGSAVNDAMPSNCNFVE